LPFKDRALWITKQKKKLQELYREYPPPFWTLTGATFIDRVGGALLPASVDIARSPLCSLSGRWNAGEPDQMNLFTTLGVYLRDRIGLPEQGYGLHTRMRHEIAMALVEVSD
jgi:hypothetical protein